MTETTGKGNELARGERLQIMIDQEELQALEDFRFDNRMPSRAAAIRELLRRGLAATGYDLDGKRRASSEYGVTRSSSNGQGEAGLSED
ncbi:hypothetical protein [Bosea sp. TAB14]|uniref:hypothetical protein n=1 Tax=Bosea sp. TAB14 TaxID=3237481 RepID=UPI000DDD5B02